MTDTAVLPDADLQSIKGVITELRDKKYRPGVVAVSAVPIWSGPDEVTHAGDRILITTAPSVLGIRDALRRRAETDWLVILTDRPAVEIPSGVAEHLVTGRLRNLDPFPLLRNAFAASKQEFGLLGDRTDIARAMLREVGDKPSPAPGGVLTNDHVFTEVGNKRFGLVRGDITPHHVAVWSMDPVKARSYEAWATHAPPVLVEQYLEWLTRRLGELGPVVVSAWRHQGPSSIVPLGLVAGLLTGTPQPGEDVGDSIPRVRTRLEMKVDDVVVTEAQLATWGALATLAVAAAPDPGPTLTAAEALASELHAESLVARSDTLPSALILRLNTFAARLAQAAQQVVRRGGAETADLGAVENAWAAVCAHRDHDSSAAPRDVGVGAAGLRLLRRLVTSWPQPTTLAEWLATYRTDLSWVDSAVNRAHVGADNPTLATANHALLQTIRVHRARLDREFAARLAAAGVHRETGAGAPLYVEDVLTSIVLPLTALHHGGTGAGLGTAAPQRSPVLVIVADGMDVASANDIVADALRHRRPQWQNCIGTDHDGPLTALSALPSVTHFSRCSLLTGALAAGGQDRERSGFADWLQQQGLRGQGQVLFHKADLDAVSKGHSLALDVRHAVQDTEGRTVVACVLNDIDDALDRSDPIGTSWTIASFKHLDALLTEAAAVGRTVVLVSDHGHVVERREQPSVQRGEQVSARYRHATGIPAADDEVLVAGDRVLTDDHRAVLAVDEQLRYTGLKAGYHGGGALAEVCISVSILVNGAIGSHLPLAPADFGPPSWWDLDDPSSTAGTPVVTSIEVRAPKKRPAKPTKAATRAASNGQESLFDLGAAPASDSSSADRGDTAVFDLVGQVLTTDLFSSQFARFGRNLTKVSIGALLREAEAANGVIPMVKVAEILDLRPAKARGAVAHLSQIFNIDGVSVIGQRGDDVIIATPLLFEQFGLSQ
ncbi:BREX-2 system phosphatase PglZ [Gordonia desulfuricans]|uniref:BREX-2 system phosphatase PglZ n=1 Tax=Gordonia desulfuricans TaxID=89051 RepID=A0A7K3LPW3_9ACTN|nr:BREX-2 system phosphatase PglZ [Gordonia desulfuricans]NDK90273.1 BREX-2 system phosphatase PglZ [Gordonia desulfuricans]